LRHKKKQNKNQEKLYLIPLGGVGEIGKNMFVVDYKDEIIILDAGLMFPEDEMLGVDMVIPDITYLQENRDKIKAIFLTHGHEDHIGALPYILPQINVPIYGTKLTLGLLKIKLEEFGLLPQAKFFEIKPGMEIQIGSLTVSFFTTNHSIPDSVGVALKTPLGNLIYTSDFKFDHTPVLGDITDFYRLAELGREGVLAVLSDSTNAERIGYTPSEKEVGKILNDIFKSTEGRIIIVTFASNVHRIQQIMYAAAFSGRKLAVDGWSMTNVVEISQELGYLDIPPATFIDLEEISNYPKEQIAILTTGTQGEPMSALARLANSNHRKMEIIPGDTVVIAANPIPGNEKLVARTIDNLFRRGANVIYEAITGVHVSGHGSQEELKLMLNLLRPQYLIPVHGEFRHLIHHAKLAERLGIKRENIFIVENGNVIEFTSEGARVITSVQAGGIFVDGLGVGDVGNIVLRDRHVLSKDGIFIIVMTIDGKAKTILSGPDIVSRGFVYVKESEELMEEAKENVSRILSTLMDKKISDWTTIKNNIKDSVSKLLWEKTGRRPMILPIIMEI
jgi:ribonuclease J